MRQGCFLRQALISVLSLCILITLSWLPVIIRPPAVLASSFVIGSDPVDGSTISTPPTRVRIFFNTPISSASIANVYFGINYQVMNAGRSHVASNNPQVLDTPLITQLPLGSYTVRWTALSTTDGQATHGVIGFNIGHSSTGLPGQVILGPSTSNILPQLSLLGILAIAWDWLVMAVLTLWIGILVIEGIVLAGEKNDSDRDYSGNQGERGRVGINPTPTFTFMTQVRKQSLSLQWLCLAALFAGEIINLILRAALITQASNNNGIDPANIFKLIVDTTYGHLWMVRIALIGAALVFLWWTTRSIGGKSMLIRNTASVGTRGDARHPIAWLTLAGLILLTLSLSEDITQLAQAHVSAVILDWLFLVTQGIWLGGAAYLGFVLLPLLFAIEPELRARSLVTLLRRYTPLIFGSMGVLLISSLFLAETSLSSVQQLITDPFGRALLVKMILVAMLLLLSAYALLFLGPQLHRQIMLLSVVNAEMPTRRTRQVALERGERRLIVTMKSVTYLGAGVLLCAAFMSFFAPPIVFPAIDYTSNTSGSSTKPSTTNNQITQTQQTGNLTVNLQITPARVNDDNTVSVRINDSNGNPVTDAQVQVSINMVTMNMGIASATIKGGNPTYVAVFIKEETFSMPGLWNVALKIQRPNQVPVQVTFQVMITA